MNKVKDIFSYVSIGFTNWCMSNAKTFAGDRCKWKSDLTKNYPFLIFTLAV